MVGLVGDGYYDEFYYRLWVSCWLGEIQCMIVLGVYISCAFGVSVGDLSDVDISRRWEGFIGLLFAAVS